MPFSSFRTFVLVAIWAVLALPLLRANAAPNIILITLDTQRADRMGFLGSKSGLTPILDRLAQYGVVFTHAYSQVPLTTASHATILTGTFPQSHGVDEFGKPLSTEIPYLPALLKEHGYKTAAFVGSIVLDPTEGIAPGFDRGFDIYDAGFRKPLPGEDRFQTEERRGSDVVERANSWLSKQSVSRFFLWIHLYDGHDPYDPPPPYSVRFVQSPYDGEIAYVDFCIGKLLSALRAKGLYDKTMIAIMADHGESLGEHGEQTHGIFLYDETIHVPLLFKFPESRFARKRLEARVGLVDVAPTLLAIAGIDVPASIQGESLLGMISQTSSPPGPKRGLVTNQKMIVERPIYAESEYPSRAFGWSPLHSLRVGKYLFIEAPRRELYDETVDPRDLRNLADVFPAITDTLAAQLRDFERKTTSMHGPISPRLLDAQTGPLGALGYVAREVTSDAAPSNDGPDPKDKIQIANLMHSALLDIEDGNYNGAIPRLEQILTEEPEMTTAQTQLGIAFSRSRDFVRALPLLQAAVTREPDVSGSIHYELGITLFGTGELVRAASAFEFAVTHAPQSADAHYSLASVYAQLDRISEAMTELRIALKVKPQHYAANLLCGRILSLQGHAEEALSYLQTAADIDPSSANAHLFLADAYDLMGQTEKAKNERSIVDRLKGSSPP